MILGMYYHAWLCLTCSFNCIICIDTYPRTQTLSKLGFRAQPAVSEILRSCDALRARTASYSGRGSPAAPGSSLSHILSSLPPSPCTAGAVSLCSTHPRLLRAGPPQLMHGPWTESVPTPGSQLRSQLLQEAFSKQLTFAFTHSSQVVD